jgi:hypothetical protein
MMDREENGMERKGGSQKEELAAAENKGLLSPFHDRPTTLLQSLRVLLSTWSTKVLVAAVFPFLL